MNSFDTAYLDILGDIMDNGVRKGDRTGTGTLSRFGTQARFNLKDNRLPLLSLRKVFHRSFIHETLWFLSGSTDIQYLKENNVSIWDSWVKPGTGRYRDMTPDEILEELRPVLLQHYQTTEDQHITSVDFQYPEQWQEGLTIRYEDDPAEGKGIKVVLVFSCFSEARKLYEKHLGKEPRKLVGGSIGTGAYGSQWRAWEDTRVVQKNDIPQYEKLGYRFIGDLTHGGCGVVYRKIDQIANVVKQLKENPDSRRILLVAYNPAKVDECQLPPCFTGDTWVSTPEGYRQIQDIQEGDMVLSGSGVPREVLQKWTTPYSGKMHSIKISYIGEKIKCTPNHPFLVKDKGWVEAKDIGKGDLVGIPRNKSRDIRKAFVYASSGNTEKDVRLTEHWLTENDYFTLGYFLGNGWCNTVDGRVCFAIPHSKVDYILPRIRRTVKVSIKPGPNLNVATYETKSYKWATFLKELGHLAHNKSIPQWVYDSPQRCISEFLEGFNEADGCGSSGFLMDVTSTSAGVAYGLQRLTSYIGILGSVGYQVRPETTVIEGRVVNQRNTYQFRLNNAKNMKSTVFEEDVIWIPVRSNDEYDDECLVYNLNVNEEHTYLANNIITHNCHSLVQWWSRELTMEERLELYKAKHSELMGEVSGQWLTEQGIAERAVSCMLYMRSSDYPVGAVFNIPQYALLTHMLAQVTGMVAEELVFTGADTHVYANQEEGVLELLQREGHPEEARVHLNPEITDIDQFLFEDIEVTSYEHDAVIRFPVAV